MMPVAEKFSRGLKVRAEVEDIVGLIPTFMNDQDQRSAREQLDSGYAFAGGWQAFQGFRLGPERTLCYPGDPPMYPLAQMRLREEVILVYEHAWVAIFQPGGEWEVCRMD